MRKGFPQEYKAILQDLAYDREMQATPGGDPLLARILEARELEHNRQFHAALELRNAVVAQLQPDDTGALASAARHDLAHSLTLEGAPKDAWAVGTAVELLRQVVSSPSRRAAPLRLAQSEMALASALRRQAKLMEDATAKTLNAEAEALLRGVIWSTGKCGDAGARTLAEAHYNLGNLLMESRRGDAALASYDKAIKAALCAEKAKHGSMRHVVAQSRLNAAILHRNRSRKGDLKAAEQLLREVIREPEGFQDQAWMALALVIQAGTADDRKHRALDCLMKVRPANLEKALERIHHASLLREFGAVDEALEVLRKWILEAIHRRSATIADFEADTASREFQPAAALAARILAQDKADAVGAFLQLENTSGLRFNETVSAFAWRPLDAFSQALYAELRVRTARSAALDATIQGQRRFQPSRQREWLEATLEAWSQARSEELSEDEIQDRPFYLQTYKEALSSPDPLEHLTNVLAQESARVVALKDALDEHDASHAKVHRLLGQEVTPEELATILREDPGQVLIRLCLEMGDLLVVAVWWDGKAVTGRSANIHLDEALPDLLEWVARGEPNVDFARITQLMAQVDLSAALPDGQRSRAVLLPSYRAAAIPLAALGPVGRRLMDRFDRLNWLASLFPLRAAPAARPPRAGHLVIVPEKTIFHSVALEPPRPGEVWLRGAEATPTAIGQAITCVQTAAIYTHGEHEHGELPSLVVGGNAPLDVARLQRWTQGLERMEIWACQTGMNRPMDMFTPPSNEASGLDFLLLGSGVRTAIGTLWSVPDIVTAAIVRKYRQRLDEGLDADASLLDAQRWWHREGLALLLEQVRQKPLQEAISDFTTQMGLKVDPSSVDRLAATLGPLSGDEMADRIQTRFNCPVSWAASRFVGIPVRDPSEGWFEVPSRPLTEEEQRKLAVCLVESSMPARGPGTFKALHEAALRHAGHLAPGMSPSSAQCIEMARLLRDRVNGSHRDNLLSALAWVHEGLAAPGLDEAQKALLAVEAAHLWVEVALDEQWPPKIPRPVALERALRLLSQVPENGSVAALDSLAVRARIHLLARGLGTDDPEAAYREALALIMPALEGLPTTSYEALRVTAIAVDLLPASQLPGFESSRERILGAARDVASKARLPTVSLPAWQRLRVALGRFEHEVQNLERSVELSTPRELVSATFLALHWHSQTSAPTQTFGSTVISESLGQMESALWGLPSDDRHAFISSTGTPGRAYRQLMQMHVLGHGLAHPHEGVHVLACLQYACDLRLSFLNRLEWFSRQDDNGLNRDCARVRDNVSVRQMLSEALADAAFVPENPIAGPMNRPHMADPFHRSLATLMDGVTDGAGISAWTLGMIPATPATRTAAFAVVQAQARLENESLETWERILDFDRLVRRDLNLKNQQGLTGMLAALKLESNEEWLANLPEGFGVLGLTLVEGEHLLVAACWNDGAGPQGRTWCVKAEGLQVALRDLLLPDAPDFSGQRGVSTASRKEAWSRLEAIFSPVLSSLMEVGQVKKRLSWGVIAPGALRPLPLLGIRLSDGRLVAEAVAALFHLPSLGFGAPGPAGPSDGMACIAFPDREGGSTAFGEATLRGSRRAHPPERMLGLYPEAEQPSLVQVRETVGRCEALRFYGVGLGSAFTDSSTGIRLSSQEGLMASHLHGLSLSSCRVVELWAATAGMADVERVMTDDADRVAGLAARLLAHGAQAVIDLAWPVHDVVKALVCELFGWESRRSGRYAECLAVALDGASVILEQLQELPATASRQDVLRRIDEVRTYLALNRWGVTTPLEPFEALADAPLVGALSGAELISELSQQVHLGAFRWWGV
ncbi:CHAT domain-containing protein [Corallococcus exercitus]|uniref:CHAT domain-containing protein n=1 Tax=Corallococcus exercitus TaxID=2316736 RepID=A0A7Y4KJ74_9BACT|nr:CHAT domain-containing protein [Corallococcus exercitus]NOK34632.1 CHAT domain-containing protein [Corallococcus exercitus]